MNIEKKNYFIFFLLALTQSANLYANSTSWMSSLRSFFTSMRISHSFKKPSLSNRWIGIGALTIVGGAALAWRYFKRHSKPQYPANTPLHKEASGKIFESTADTNFPNQNNFPKAGSDILEPIIASAPKSDNAEGTTSDNNNSEEPEPLPERKEIVDNQIQAEHITKSNPKEHIFEVHDVVKIVNDESIDFSPNDKKLYFEVAKKEFNKIPSGRYLNQCGTIRNIYKDFIEIEMRTIEPAVNGQNKKPTAQNFSAYFSVLPEHIIKMKLKTLNDFKKGTLVRTALTKKILEDRFKNENLSVIPQDIASIESSIGILQAKNLNVVSVEWFFHWRPGGKSLNFNLSAHEIQAIYDPKTNKAIRIE